MRRYNPYKQPDAETWLALDEQERIALVEEYHRRKRLRMPSPVAHAAFHAIVENQLAMGIHVVVDTFQRLQEEGLNRHDAIHAIGRVLAGITYGVAKRDPAVVEADINEEYQNRLKVLTAKSWLAGE